MRVLVCGGRDYANAERVFGVLDRLTPAPTAIIAGGASGADDLARRWAEMWRTPCAIYRADWALGRQGGPLRNQRMIDDGRPDLVIAFPGGRGTADMVRRAKAAGVPVREVA